MYSDPLPARNRFWRLSLRQILALTALFALACTIWMNHLQAHLLKEAEWQAKLRAQETAMQEAERLRVALLQSIVERDATAVEQLLKAGANPNDLPRNSTYPRESMLNVAIRNGDLASFRALVESGAELNAALPLVPLEAVVRASSPLPVKTEMLHILLARGAHAALGRSAMDAALELEAAELVGVLRQAGTAYGPREMALAGSIQELRAELAADPKLLSSPVDDFYHGCKSLLGIALARGHEDLAAWLLDAGAPLDIYEVHHMSAMHMAAMGDCTATIERLQRAGCEVNVGDVTGDTPLDYCVSTASPATIRALIEAGADVNRPAGPQRQTALHRAVKRYDSASGSDAANQIALKIIEILLDAGADPNLEDSSGRTSRELALARLPAGLEVYQRFQQP